MATKPTNGVAWLQKIDNGILVHYYVPVRYRKPRSRFPRFMEQESWQEPPQTDDMEPVPEGQIVERYGVSVKTVFCPSFEEVCDAIEVALKAAETIEGYRQDGKLTPGYPFP